ncbi:hypothetical protein HYW72_02590 [Candidatus Nomurabacteria bacterium]|nr:hypothetical protein [Candidatus Nomurabacteria bacterium]
MGEKAFLEIKVEQKKQNMLDNFAVFARIQAEQVLKGTQNGMTLESAVERIKAKIKLIMEETEKSSAIAHIKLLPRS